MVSQMQLHDERISTTMPALEKIAELAAALVARPDETKWDKHAYLECQAALWQEMREQLDILRETTCGKSIDLRGIRNKQLKGKDDD